MGVIKRVTTTISWVRESICTVFPFSLKDKRFGFGRRLDNNCLILVGNSSGEPKRAGEQEMIHWRDFEELWMIFFVQKWNQKGELLVVALSLIPVNITKTLQKVRVE